MAIVTCIGMATSTVRCTRRSVIVVKAKVPGGTLKGAACMSHYEAVKARVLAEAAQLVLAAA